MVDRDVKHPMWVGLLWTPRHTPWKPVVVEALFEERRNLHRKVRDFYTDKAAHFLWHIFLFDRYFGFLNLIFYPAARRLSRPAAFR
jgi:hypothetical protein